MSCRAVVNFGRTFTGTYMPGQPYDFVTVAPNGRGETLAATGIAVQITLRTQSGAPLIGLPPQAFSSTTQI